MVDVYTFIGRMMQHVFAQGFKRLRYYGVQATKTVDKMKGLIRAALAKGKGVLCQKGLPLCQKDLPHYLTATTANTAHAARSAIVACVRVPRWCHA